MQILLVNQPGTDSGIEDLTRDCDLPVLQDTTQADTFEEWGASKWYLYFLGTEGELLESYYHLAVDGSEADRFVAEVEARL